MDPNRQYIRSIQGHARLIASFSPQAKLALLEELESPAAMNGDFDAAIDRLRGVIWDDAKAALIWSAVIVALGSDLEAMRQKGQLKPQLPEGEAFRREIAESVEFENPDDDWDFEDSIGDSEEEEDWE